MLGEEKKWMMFMGNEKLGMGVGSGECVHGQALPRCIQLCTLY